MKRKLVLSLFFVCIAFTAGAQDIIIRETGEEIQAKVIEVNAGEVKYKKVGNESGPTYTFLKSDIISVPVYSDVKVEHTQDVSGGSFFFRIGFNF
jgi:hypothetical protein